MVIVVKLIIAARASKTNRSISLTITRIWAPTPLILLNVMGDCRKKAMIITMVRV